MTAAVYVYGGFLSAENPALDAGMCFYAANFFLLDIGCRLLYNPAWTLSENSV